MTPTQVIQNLPCNIYYLQQPVSTPTIGEIIGHGETRYIDGCIVALKHHERNTYICIGVHVVQLLGVYQFDELYFHHHEGMPVIISGSIVWKLSSFRNQKELQFEFRKFSELVTPVRKFENIHYRCVDEKYVQMEH